MACFCQCQLCGVTMVSCSMLLSPSVKLLLSSLPLLQPSVGLDNGDLYPSLHLSVLLLLHLSVSFTVTVLDVATSICILHCDCFGCCYCYLYPSLQPSVGNCCSYLYLSMQLSVGSCCSYLYPLLQLFWMLLLLFVSFTAITS